MENTNYRTNEQGLNCLSFKEIEKIQDTFLALRPTVKFENFCKSNFRRDFIQTLFSWEESKEGWEYWTLISKKWETAYDKQKKQKT